MTDIIQFLLRHGYVVLFGAVFIEQIGVPIPSAPVLLAAGALAAVGKLSFPVVLLLAVGAALLGDMVWFQLGRRRGHNVLRWICRLSLEPDSCVRRTEDIFARHGGRALLAAKFIPGLNTAATPMAGLLGMNVARFILYDAAGTLMWAGAFTAAGFLFSAELEDVARPLARLGNWAVLLAISALACYLAWKYLQRRRFRRQLRIARISPDELARKLAAGENLAIVDLRHALELEADGAKLPGAIQMVPAELELRHQEIPRDRDIVLYCT